MIDGKLTEMGHEPPNVLLILETEVGGAPRLLLQDEEGVFLTVDSESLGPERDEEEEEEEQEEEESEEDEKGGVGGVAGGGQEEKIERLEGEVERLKEQNSALLEELRASQATVEVERDRVKEKARDMWHVTYKQISDYDAECVAKDTEIADLHKRIEELEAHGVVAVHPPPRGDKPADATPRKAAAGGGGDPSKADVSSMARKGKAPPVDAYKGDDVELRLDNWLPTLDRAAKWNSWTEEEKLMQLAGHLRGRALQEWNLLQGEDKGSYGAAVSALRSRLDPGNKMLAVQDFRHAAQADAESVADYVRRLERLYQVAYGRDSMGSETREALLHSQLQEGLRYDLMRSPAVSGALSYTQLCMAAKHEEKRLVDLKRRQAYQRGGVPKKVPPENAEATKPGGSGKHVQFRLPARKCYECGSSEHLSWNCNKTKHKKESPGRPRKPGEKGSSGANMKMVKASDDPVSYLHSSSESEEEGIRLVRVKDRGSRPRTVTVELQGVPVKGVVDSGADITIMGAEVFKKVAAAAHLKKSAFKKADKVPVTYDGKTFQLDGRMDLDISFDGHMMTTAVYLKMDVKDSLLLSEGVCRQLKIISYHPKVDGEPTESEEQRPPVVPTVRVRLVQSLRLLPNRSARVEVQLEESRTPGEYVLEPSPGSGERRMQVDESLVRVTEEGRAAVVITNHSLTTQKAARGALVGVAAEADLASEDGDGEEGEEGEMVELRAVAARDVCGEEEVVE